MLNSFIGSEKELRNQECTCPSKFNKIIFKLVIIKNNMVYIYRITSTLVSAIHSSNCN